MSINIHRYSPYSGRRKRKEQQLNNKKKVHKDMLDHMTSCFLDELAVRRVVFFKLIVVFY